MVPKPQTLYPEFFQNLFPHYISLQPFRQSMLKTVQFNRQLRVETVKIQDLAIDDVLAAKFKSGETPASQLFPELFFFDGLVTAKLTRYFPQTYL